MPNTQIKLTVYRDRFAPYDPSLGKSYYSSPLGKSFQSISIKEITNVTEGGVTYGHFLHHETDGEPRHRVLTIELSGAIIALTNV